MNKCWQQEAYQMAICMLGDFENDWDTLVQILKRSP